MSAQRVIVRTEGAATPSASYSQAVRSGDLVFTAGQIGADPVTGALAGDLPGQVRTALANLEAVLESAGAGLDTLIKTTCLLSRIEDFAVFDEVYRDVVPEPFPGRSTFGVGLAGELLFEIEAVAVVRDGSAGVRA